MTNVIPLSSDDVVAQRYRILEEIGRGGYAIVYRATDLQTGQDIALKTIHPDAPQSQEVIERFKREAILASKLRHPNTVQVYDYGVEGTFYLAMELLEGHPLTEELNGHDGIDVDRAVAIGCAILASLSEAHTHGIVHRDIKPENIFLKRLPSGSQRVKVLDFGIAKLTGAAQRQQNMPALTMMGRAMGTPTYMSPEQAQAKPVTASSDLYAVAVLLYELIDGVPPFQGEDAMEVMLKHVNDPPPPLARAGLSRSRINHTLLRALEKHPDDRFANASAFLAALQEC